MNRRYNFLIILLLSLSFRLGAQPAEITYLGTVAKVGSANNAIYGPFNIEFNFTFFGNVYSQFYINSNGQINFGVGSDYPENYTIPDATPLDLYGAPIPNNFIAPFWDDLQIDASGSILYRTIGAAPNRKLIVQFRNMGFYGGPVYMGTFSVILYEISGVIQSQYRIIPLESATKPHGESATIGLENLTGTAGALYSYNNPAAITSRQAISFTPLAGNYTINSNAVYDGVYLTTNLTLPEPGITPLVSPAENATIGPDPTFTWSASTNAASYSLKLSTNSSLSGATSYNAGSNLSYSLTGLIPGTTYYWGVFATNATGITWGEVRKFTVSSNPPLAAVPQTIYTEQSADKTIKLNYTGGDASAKTAIITAIPAQGQLYQFNAGVRGALISTVPTTVTDAAMNVIYYASGSSGNSVGNFSFMAHDATGDSPAALITVNVSPPGIPNLLYVAKSTSIEMQFDRPMANPAGKQTEFTVTVNGSPVAVSTLALKTGDNNSIIATLITPLAGGETVLISYTAGTIASVQGGWLATFTNQSVSLTAQTITFTQSLDKKYSDSPFTLTASATGGALTYSSSNAGVATATGSVLTFNATGSSDITARQAGNGTYAPAKYSKPLTVAKGDQTITFAPLPAKTYGDSDFSLSAGAGSLLPVSFISSNTVVATVTGSTVHIVGAGTTTITASQAGNALWNAAPDVPRTLTVNKATATVTPGNLITIYSGMAQSVTATTTPSGLTVDFTYDGSATVPINTGSYSVITTINDLNYQGTASATFLINKATLTATADDKSRLYGEVNPFYTITYAGFVNSETVSVIDAVPAAASTALQTTVVGTVPITLSGGNDNNYTILLVNGTLTINKAQLTVTADDKTRIYAENNPPLTINYSGFANGENETVLDVPPIPATAAVPSTDAGTVPIIVSGGSDNNYSFIYVNGTLTITKATAIVTPGNLTTIYNGLPQSVTAATTPSGLTVDFTYDGSATVPVNTGSYSVIATINDLNYQGTASATFLINKATLTATADDKSRLYGEVNPAFTVSYSGFVNNETASVIDAAPAAASTALQTTGVGSVPITLTGGIDNNYTILLITGTLTINKAQLIVTADDKSRTYADSNPPLTISYSGFANSENESVVDTPPIPATAAVPSTDAGTVPITVSGGSDDNYSFIYVNGILTITKASQTITFSVLANKTYGDSDFTVSAVAGSSLPVDFSSSNPAVANVTANTVHIVGAGTTTITASQTGNINYNAAPDVLQILTVDKALLTFTADNKSKEYLAQIPVLTYTVTGFVGSDGSDDLNTLPTLTTSALQSSLTGTYPITISGGSDDNYAYLYLPGELRITKLGQTILLVAFPEKILVGDEFTLEATSTSGLVVLFESMDNNIALITGNIIKGISKGNVQIRAYHPGDVNYNSTEVLASVEVYSSHKEVMHLFTPNNDGFNDYWELPDLATWGKCDVKVFSRSGKLVFSDPDYNNLWDGMSNGYPVPEGAYYFLIKTENAGTIKGTVNIVR